MNITAFTMSYDMSLLLALWILVWMSVAIWFRLVNISRALRDKPPVAIFNKPDISEPFKDPYSEAWEGDPDPDKRMETL